MADPNLVENLLKQIEVIQRSKISLEKKLNLQYINMKKKIEKLSKTIDGNNTKLIEKEKEIKLYQIKLREFLVKNQKTLPVSSFKDIENIIIIDSQPESSDGGQPQQI